MAQASNTAKAITKAIGCPAVDATLLENDSKCGFMQTSRPMRRTGLQKTEKGRAGKPKEMGAGIAASPHCAERRIRQISKPGPRGTLS
jgi:hypothetical protein